MKSTFKKRLWTVFILAYLTVICCYGQKLSTANTVDSATIVVPKKLFVETVKNAELGVFCCERITEVTVKNRQLKDTVTAYQSKVFDLRKRLNREKQKKLRNRWGFGLATVSTIFLTFLR